MSDQRETKNELLRFMEWFLTSGSVQIYIGATTNDRSVIENKINQYLEDWP